MILKAAREGKGEIILGIKDKERLGKDFISRVNKKLEKRVKAELVLQKKSKLLAVLY